MLNGTVRYKDYTYKAYGYDTPADFKLRLTSSNYKAIVFMGNSSYVETGDELWERGISVSSAKITVETAVNIDETTGKKVKGQINNEFFCMLGALIRYVKSHCYVRYMEGYSVINLASGEYEPEKEVKYIIPFEKTKDILAIVKLRLGNVVSMHIKSGLFTIDLEDDRGMDGDLYPTFKDGVARGFALNEDYLGFPILPQVVEHSTMLGGMYRNLEEVIEAHPDKDFFWLRHKRYYIVKDENLEEICNYIYDFDGKVYYDTETSGLNINFKSRIGQADQVVGIILSVIDGESFFFPMQMKAIKNLCGGDHSYFMEKYMRRILEGKELVAHNLSFDWKAAYVYDINANIVDDTMALIKLTLGAEDESLSVALKTLTRIFLNRDSLELDDLVIGDSWGENEIRFWDLPEELVKYYACADTDNTRGLFKYAEKANLLSRYDAHKVYEIEIAFSYAVAYQEFYGHLFDVDEVDSLREKIVQSMAKYKKEMVDIIGHDFNPNSSPQLLKILYGELGYPAQISRKTNRPTTDKDALKFLGELTNLDGQLMYPVCALLLKYREYEGVRKIIDKFPELATADGYLFPDVQQYGTRTGRVSIKEPNYQSYNKPVKQNIIPRPGYYMFDTDYSSIEYRVLGNMAGNKMIKENFYDPDFDYHTYQASRMYRIPYANVTGKLRKAAKGINFGLPYGMGDQSLGVRIFGEESEENTMKASALRRSYFKGQEDIQVFFDTARSNGITKGYTETYFKRRRYYDSKKFSTGSIKRQAGNQVIQGCLSYGTRIQTKEFGIVKIGDAEGRHLNVWDGEGWTTADITYSGKKQKCIVHFRGGLDIVCSPNHKFQVISHRGMTRFVECQDLRGYECTRNPHRVVINETYAKSDYVYNSEDAYKYAGKSNNANNIFLENIGDSFVEGVILGRLASDGSVFVREDGGSYAEHIIAEHEIEIAETLELYMSKVGCIPKTNAVRDERNQSITNITTYSKSFASELLDLDIKHQVHENIFMDTELLRGFIQGMFDGDGGITGKTITLVFGTQYDFEPMCKDLQKALLFFGIRSHYRKYDDRHVIAIRTHDNEKFLERIGFLNSKKQKKGYTLHTIEDEHIFGPCLAVDSVEITDEYIDMFDVCNTVRGCFIADGVVTHNSAADIYKIAVGRVFKRISREGWLGKVMLSGFIHDELLGEVSYEIDPMVWLKTLREEFEVSIEESDGTKWCPLYMGFGWGRNWQEAKSVEIPIKLQWELVEKYGETGFPSWNKDINKFCDAIPDMLRAFEIKDCGNQLLDEKSQGKEIKPALNSNILGVLKEDRKLYKECIEDNSLMEKYHISGFITDSDGNIMDSVPETSDTQEAITYFCMLHGLDRSKIDIMSISDNVEASLESSDKSDVVDDYDDDYEDEMAKVYAERQEAINSRIQALGMYVDTEKHEIRGAVVPAAMLNIIKNYLRTKEKCSNGYLFKLYDTEKGLLYDTPYVVASKDITGLQSVYTTYKISSVR